MTSDYYQKKLEKFRLRQEEKKLRKKELEKEKRRKQANKNQRKYYKKKKEEVKQENKTLLEHPKEKKKKVGRPKKRGPKKKRIRRKIIKTHKPQPVFDFKIISCLNGKQNGHVGQYHNFAEAILKFKELEASNSEIVFPRKYINSSELVTAKDEYLMLEKNRFGDKQDGMVRNDYGKYILTKIINSDKWVVRDKMKRLVEETFWVYGFDPKLDRKNFTWVYDNLFVNPTSNRYNIVRFLVYKNKLVVRYDDRETSMIMCKNKSDAIRMYNMLSDKTEKNKQIFGLGSYNAISEKRRELETEIMELTGWPKTKIQRSIN